MLGYSLIASVYFPATFSRPSEFESACMGFDGRGLPFLDNNLERPEHSAAVRLDLISPGFQQSAVGSAMLGYFLLASVYFPAVFSRPSEFKSACMGFDGRGFPFLDNNIERLEHSASVRLFDRISSGFQQPAVGSAMFGYFLLASVYFPAVFSRPSEFKSAFCLNMG